jgi:hypothetical protein
MANGIVHKKLLGDPAASGAYLPFALSKLRELRKTGLPYITQTYQVDGFDVNVVIMGGEEYVTISGCSIKMESGNIFLGDFNVKYLQQIDTCKIYRGNYAAAAALDDKRVSKPLMDYSKVYAMPVPPPEPDAKPYDPLDEESIPGKTSRAHLDLLEKKAILNGMQVSRFTGKTRLLVQAILGSNPLRFKNLLLDGAFGISGQHAVYRDNHFVYWLINVGSSRPHAIKLEFNPCGEAIRKKLKEGKLSAAAADVEEAYMFASLKIYKKGDVEERTASNYTEHFLTYGTYPEFGTPLCWGWNFSRSTGKGICVKLRRQSNTNPLDELNEGSVARMTFSSGSSEGAPPSVSILISGTAMFQLERYESTLYSIAYGVNTPTFGRLKTNLVPCEAPVYAFYDINDVEKIFYFRREYNNTPVIPTTIPTLYACGFDANSAKSEGHAYTSTVTMFCGAGEEVFATSINGLNDYESEMITVPGGIDINQDIQQSDAPSYPHYVLSCESPLPDLSGLGTGPGTYWTAHIALKPINNKSTTKTKIGAKDRSVFLLVSVSCPNCVYIGSRSAKYTNDTVNETTYTGSFGIADYVGYAERPGGGNNTNAYPSWYGKLISPQWGTTSVIDSLDTVQEMVEMEINIAVEGYAYSGPIHHVKVGGSKSTTNLYDEWNYVLLPDEEFKRTYFAKESYNGSCQYLNSYQNGHYTVVGGGYLDATNYIGYA